jgi:site-specific DNA-methyltransferase (adenine-specific)
MWVYGSGFPKSHNIGKAIDKIEGNDREVIGYVPQFPDGTRGATYRGQANNTNDVNFFVSKDTSTNGLKPVYAKNNEWEGWGTALKPAHEPIVMARKPLSEKSIAENVLKHGTGGINIDGSRISHNEPIKVMKAQEGGNKVFGQGGRYEETTELKPEGRFPANIIFDEEAGQLLDEQSGISKSQGGNSGVLNNKIYGNFKGEKNNNGTGFNDKGGASRFFYCPKAAKKDRDEGMDGFEDKLSEIAQINSQTKLQPNGEYVENITLPRKNIHPTVKPTDLMRYLINLVTPPNGTTLDPFMGSGSTGKAAVRCGVNFIGIEREQEYMDIASARINHELNKEENAKK